MVGEWGYQHFWTEICFGEEAAAEQNRESAWEDWLVVVVVVVVEEATDSVFDRLGGKSPFPMAVPSENLTSDHPLS